jgi:DNA helicase-2/ATP-dependent DNA helicase PcrA
VAAYCIAELGDRRSAVGNSSTFSQPKCRYGDYNSFVKGVGVCGCSILSDNPNYDDERRLLYVALTRAERYLFVTTSSPRSVSRFIRELTPMITAAGGTDHDGDFDIAATMDFTECAFSQEDRLATSFSDLRYYIECPHDFYLRKALGYTPSIGQEFGYGRGVHNVLREVHSNPRRWAELAATPMALQTEIERLVESGLFYLRYTTGDPLENLKRAAVRGVQDYVTAYVDELQHLDFEPEKEFETLISDENVLISSAIDLVRLDDPPRVTIVDFKSGDSENDNSSGLSEELMRLQIGVYGLAARHELEYDPEHGYIRYIGEEDPDRRETYVGMTDVELENARQDVIRTAQSIRERDFHRGPAPERAVRCQSCDFGGICGRRNY